MAQRKPSKNDALEALDFIIAVLKEHEKNFDRLINELGAITEKMGERGENTEKIDRLENRLSSIQDELAELVKFVSTSGERLPTMLTKTETQVEVQSAPEDSKTRAPQQTNVNGPPVTIRCKQWQDFKLLAQGADSVSFLHKDAEKTFQADALKNGRVLTYNGTLPESVKLLKVWLAQELGTAEVRIYEGVLTVG
jgi:hypothetical protein